MLKVFKSKAFLGVVCLLLAAAIAFFVLPRFYEAKTTTKNVVRVAESVPAGTALTKAMLSTVEAGAYGLSDKVYSIHDFYKRRNI